MRLLRRSGGGSSFLVGVILLLLLLVFAAPSNLPRFVSTFFPQFYEGVPCSWLRTAEDRGNHQSLLGRSAEAPLTLRVAATTISRDPAGVFYINIIVTNESLGTVGLVYDPTQVIVGDNNTSGLGLIFTPPVALPIGSSRQDSTTVPEEDIRLLGPRQRCVHTVEIPNTNVLLDTTLTSGTANVRAYYRNNVRGQVLPTPGIAATPIFNDQGLWTGLVTSDAATISIAPQ
jgi:hypothetical protein